MKVFAFFAFFPVFNEATICQKYAIMSLATKSIACILLLSLNGIYTTAECPENPTMCMMDFLKHWEEIRMNESNATNVLLPVIYYSKPSIISLCESYSNSEQRCALRNCSTSNPVVNFANRHFSYICNLDVIQVWIQEKSCISEELFISNCTSKIEKEPKIGEELYCENLRDFSNCIQKSIDTQCSSNGFEIISKIISNYGCEFETEIPITSPIPPMEQLVTISLEVEANNSTEILRTTIVEKSEIEGSGFLEMSRKIAKKKVKKPKRFTASNMSDCYSSIMADFGRFLKSTPSSSFVRFPLFGLKPMEIDVLCSKYEIVGECVESFCIGNCRYPPVKSFVDSQLREACRMRNSDEFEMEFSCLQKVLENNEKCTAYINTTLANRCEGHRQFRSCVSEQLLNDCSEDTVEMLVNLQTGYGCRLLSEVHEHDEMESSGVEGSAQSTIPDLGEELLLTENVQPKTCEKSVRENALSCIAPLLRLWTGIKENRQETKVVFPIFEFSKIELLELCDAFINYRNCIRRTDSQICHDLPVIKFADEHFEETCSSQTIEASIRTHDCVNEISMREMEICNKYSKGDTLPGKRKCTKVHRFTKCLRKLVTNSCGPLILAHFDAIVDKFGC